MFRYTPISDPDSKGYFDLLIKVKHYELVFGLYSAYTFMKMPLLQYCTAFHFDFVFIFLFMILQVYPEGKMSQHFSHLKPGDIIEVKG